MVEMDYCGESLEKVGAFTRSIVSGDDALYVHGKVISRKLS